MPTIDALSERLESYLSHEHILLVRRAYFYAEQAHQSQRRRSGEPYIIHPLAVANILAEMRFDHQSLMAAMLHDVIEDTGIPKEALEEQFGSVVTELVDGVSKLTHIEFATKEEQQAENFQKMVMAMARDIRVILVKLADRLHNLRTLGALKPEKRRRIGRETLDIYAPIANRLGLNSIRVEMEELCFEAMYPMRAGMIRKAVNKARGNRKELVEEISSAIRNRLKEEGLTCRVIGREKHLYSIYRKMRDQKKSLADIMDVYGFRIIVESVDTCYRVLGVSHNLYKPIPGRFKDYIAIPKANGYQSLHTTLIGMSGVPIEIQIRTEEMESMANHGIAAHWLYKSDEEFSGKNRAQQWVQNLLELQKSAGSPIEFIEHVKVDLFPEEIYVFTPKGKIFELPKGATPVDFAYALHTDVGNGCIACRIDKQLAPLSSTLQNGQTIQIVTAPGSNPNPAWLSFVATSKARSNIRHFLKNQRLSESVNLGKRLLDKALAAHDKSIEDIDQENIDAVLKETGTETFDQVLADIGLGNRMASLFARRLLAAQSDEEIDLISVSEDAPLAIKGTEGLVVGFAKCCCPIPGDPIMGHVSSGKGLVIHTETCQNIEDLRDNPEKCIHLSWDKNIDSEFSVELRVYQENRKGLVAELASAATQADANIERFHVEDKDARLSVTLLQVHVNGRKHLARVIRRLRNIPGVNKIVRIKS